MKHRIFPTTILFLVLAISFNMASADHFKTQVYTDHNSHLLKKMIDSQQKKNAVRKQNQANILSAKTSVMEVQRKLVKFGFNPGLQDGKWGPNTKTALVKYLRIHHGILFDGKLDSNELKILKIPSKNNIQKKQVIYFGFGLWGNEKWSTGDAEAVGTALENFYPERIVSKIIFSQDEYENLPNKYPSVYNNSNILDIIEKLDITGKSYLIVIGLYSHGLEGGKIFLKLGESNPDNKIEQQKSHIAIISPKWIKEKLLKKLQGQSGVLIVSSCYSGYFIDKLKAPHIVIATASRTDRTSFGCSPTATGTRYGKAVQKALNNSEHSRDYSLIDAFKKAQKIVKNIEISQGEKVQSFPQLFIGDKFSE